MDLREQIGGIRTPTAIIAGREDPATPVAMMEGIRDAIAGARLTVIPDAAHLLAVEQPTVTADLLRQAIRAAG